VERPEPNYGGLTFDAAASTKGSYLVIADAEAPALWTGWRAGLTLTAARANRLGYYGLGNATRHFSDSATAAQPYFYQVSRSVQSLRVTLQRRVVGPVRVLAGAILQHTDYRPLPGPSVFQRDLGSGAIAAGTVPFSDHVVRAGLIVDNRDNELDPHRGVFAEGLVARGRGYTRSTAVARVWLHPLEKFFVAARLGAERMTGTPPVAAQQVLETSEQPLVALGGYRTLRGLYDARFTGPGKLLGGAELRYALLWAPTVLELKIVAFYDVGRVFGAGEPVRLTTDGLHHSGGMELAARFFRNAIVVVGYGKGSEGGQLLFGTTWSY